MPSSSLNSSSVSSGDHRITTNPTALRKLSQKSWNIKALLHFAVLESPGDFVLGKRTTPSSRYSLSPPELWDLIWKFAKPRKQAALLLVSMERC
jgi:hypothetical protein